MSGWRPTAACERAARLISLELDGELGRRERAVLERHLGRCPDCARRKEIIGTVTTILRISPPERPSRNVTIPVPAKALSSRKPRALVSLVTLAVLAATASAVLSAPRSHVATSSSAVVLAQRVRVVEAELVPPQNLRPLKDDLPATTPTPAQPLPACSLGCWSTAND